MDLERALRTTGAVREFSGHPVPDEVVYHILDTARYAPSGGNRQAWRIILVKDASLRRQLRDLYLHGWYEYLSMTAAGLVPWAPLTDRDAEKAALSASPPPPGDGFAEHFDEVPVLLVLLADLGALAAVDRDLDRYQMVAGASIYPFAWSILLAAHDAGLGGVVTTMVIREEDEVRRLLGVPPEWAVAAALALGYPAGGKRATRLRRAPVEDFTRIDEFDGEPLAP